MYMRHLMSVILLALGLNPNAAADEVLAAVAANFTSPFKELSARFELASGHRVRASFGSTGRFYAQINQGAPFDVFYAADRKTPQQLVTEGLALGDSLYTYAFGTLVLWSPDAAKVDAEGKVLEQGEFAHLALANPKTAPYGAAAQQALVKLGLAEALQAKLVQGESITQAYQFAATGNTELAFIAFSQLQETGAAQGSSWRVPPDLYAPIEQSAVVLKRAEHSAAVQAFVAFMRSAEARAVVERYGYTVQ